MRFILIALSFTVIAFGSTLPTMAKTKVSLAQAEAICLERAKRFASSTRSRDHSYPQPNQVKDRYRACVFANSGRYPSVKLIIRGTRVTTEPK